MAIFKSEIVGKSIGTLRGITTGEKHHIWNNFTIDAVDFLSRCTLSYSNSYGASYKIDPTSELTIIHTNGTKYPINSYKKLLTIIITDYDEPQEQPMPTKPRPGTHWERLKDLADHSPKGEIVIVEQVITNYVSFSGYRELNYKEFLNRFKPRPDLDTQVSDLAEDNTIKAKLKVGDTIGYNEEYCNASNYSIPDRTRYKIIGTVIGVKEQDSGRNPLVSYKTLSGSTDTVDEGWVEILPSPSTKTAKPVAQLEPIIPTPIKETFMSKIKNSASATVDQNKQALVIASKMEAGRIINKQVLKQLTSHLPFFLQGYAKSPFAPFIAANLVAMVANHTGNSKLTKVSDLMLLGAADSGVAAFNLDKIVDDILSNIKLPAGVLDQDIE